MSTQEQIFGSGVGAPALEAVREAAREAAREEQTAVGPGTTLVSNEGEKKSGSVLGGFIRRFSSQNNLAKSKKAQEEAAGCPLNQKLPAGHPKLSGSCPFAGKQMKSPPRVCSFARRHPPLLDLRDLRAAIKSLMKDWNHDDGSYAPLFIRLAWHCCGTYDKTSQTGGSNGGTMRFPVEQNDPENAGLGKARALLDPLLDNGRFPGMTTADLYILAGYVAFESVGGPKMQFRVGRQDFSILEAESLNGPGGCPFGDSKLNDCGSRLPAGDLGSKTASETENKAANVAGFRAIFARLGMTDRESVALILMGHSLGRMHEENSGFSDNTWTHKPINWNLDRNPGFFSGMENGEHSFTPQRAPNGGVEYANGFGFGHLAGADMPLVWDRALNNVLHEYRRDRKLLRREASGAWKKLTTLGCADTLQPETHFEEDIMHGWITGPRW